MMEKRITTIIVALSLWASAASAVTLSFTNFEADHTSSGDFTVTGAYDTVNTNDFIYTFTANGQDFDGVGGTNDSFSFDLRFETFDASTVVNGGVGNGASSVTLGTSALSGDGSARNFGIFDGGTNDLDASDSYRLSIENMSVTSDLAFAATFNGFTQLRMNPGTKTIVIGEGSGLDSYTGSPITLPSAVSELVVTALGNNTRMRGIDASFEMVAVPEAGTYALIVAGAVGFFVLLRRRK